jgi:hypothetical protein
MSTEEKLPKPECYSNVPDDVWNNFTRAQQEFWIERYRKIHEAWNRTGSWLKWVN